ncbi:MAG: sigma-70 family RNA polymerase sigma factor [Chloroflexota bacterium]|nr:sigma-70 family RNA polymerase sigma factor [Chloroflexota bacterium]
MATQQDARVAGEDWQEAAVQRAKSNNADFGLLYRHYFPRIYNYCLRRVGDRDSAEDLCSTVFTRTLSNLHTYKSGSFAAWIFSIAHNVVANFLRDRRPQLSIEEESNLKVRQLADPGEDTLDRIVRVEEVDTVARLIARLPEDQRELLTLRIAGELSAKEIGAVLGKSEGAVRTALHRIVQQLRTAYQQGQAE